MSFPQLSNISKEIVDTINSRAGNNQKVSGMMPWIRVISTLGDFLVIETEARTVSFAEKYGDSTRSGKVGTDKNGNPVYAEEGDRGFRPSPTISEIQLKQGNEGLSKKITFNITAYTVKQAELIMEHFLEPGKMVLVEWGENSALSVSQKVSDLTEPCNLVAYNNLAYLQEKRAKSNGTYDAMLGTIVGGGTQFGDNETYTIEVELMAIGELPAYLQHHKNIAGDDPDVANSSKKFDVSDIESTAEDEDIGRALFMQMFNELPEHKRTAEVKNLQYENWAIDPKNYINMDSEIREDLVKGLASSAASVKLDGEKLDVPSDTPLFSDKRFIRCALAFTILDLQPDIDIVNQAIENGCKQAKRSPALVSWQNTACRAHKHMFSSNTDILYIPNKQAPKFDLKAALIPTEDADGNTKALESPISSLKSLNEASGIADIHPGLPDDTEKHYYFPNQNPISLLDQGVYDDTHIAIEADAHRWGWLKDLYINFDFFCDVLRSSGLITRDVWYKILNGMSSAVNLYWNFQIVPRGCTEPYMEGSNSNDPYMKQWADTQISETGDELLQIVDASFIGKVPAGAGKAKFQARGTRTPFLSATFDMSIPGGMKGQVIGHGLSKSVKNPNAESKEVDFTGLFSNKIDTVKEKLNSINNKIKESEKSEEDLRREQLKKQGLTPTQINNTIQREKNKATDENNKEQQKQNYEFFAQTACVVPNIQDRNKDRDIKQEWYDVLNFAGNDVGIESIAIVGGWNDTSLLKTVQKFDDGYIKPEEGDLRRQENLPLLPIKFNFTIHGVSGLRVGDTFSIPDLPLTYGTKVFQVTQVEQTISQNIWTTSVSGQLRLMEASPDEAPPYKGKQ